MAKVKLKTIEQLKERIQTHYNLYKEYLSIGKIRAEGKLWSRGRVEYQQSTGYNSGFGAEIFKIQVNRTTKSQPHFKGKCQAMGTGDSFNVAAWLNRDGSIRIEIYEKDGYAKHNISNNLPF